MIYAKIYPTKKSPTQSGRARQAGWVLDVESNPGSIRDLETAWNATSDTLRQIKITFDSLISARTFADSHNLKYSIDAAHIASPRRRTYAENFRRAQ
ncbi:MAG: ETC complex I subunit [Candidatus Paracaedibacteraceae bacterium]|nr:ETC complex I subunit [Candidatus Paracaedibacteraceae bacterium]